MKVTVVLVLAAVLLATEANRSKNRGKGSMWWGIAKAGEPNNLSPISPGVLYMDPSVHGTLRRKQRRLARENPGLLVALAKGANNAIHECQYQFRSQRWNCSTRNFLRGKNLFGKIVDRGCRETAFIYAITSAAVTHAIARACSEGSIDTCNCEPHYKGRPQGVAGGSGGSGSGGGGGGGGGGGVGVTGGSGVAGVRDFEWGGCSDNIGFGFSVSREFVDTGERGKSLREKMNLHNNEAGRWHVQNQMRQECKCHGMSGSCTVKTCWMRLPPFRVIGDLLKDRFDGASHVTASNAAHQRNSNKAHKPKAPTSVSANTSNNNNNDSNSNNNNNNINNNNAISNSIHSKRENRRKVKYGFQLKPFNPDHKPPGVKDLVYYEMSPGFCEKNPKLGIQGTHGRHCNDTSMGVDGCDIMCCGRGYRTQEVTVVERCNCTFHWCCEVKCEVCRLKKTIHSCV